MLVLFYSYYLCKEFVPPVFPVFLDCLFIHCLNSIRGHGQLVQVHRGYRMCVVVNLQTVGTVNDIHLLSGRDESKPNEAWFTF